MAKMTIEKGFFSTREEILDDIKRSGFWPTTYVSGASPELPLHWHDGDILGYLVDGETYVLDENKERVVLGPGDKLIIPAGALHAEGKVTDPVTYIVTTEKCVQMFDALTMLDPDSYPDPQHLKIDPSLFASD